MLSRRLVSLTILIVLISCVSTVNVQLIRTEPTTIVVADDYPSIQETINVASSAQPIQEPLSTNSTITDMLSIKHNESSFTPVIANVLVLYPDDKPMPHAMVVAINHEYYFRYTETTDVNGSVSFKAMTGNWSFFAYPGRSSKGMGYFPCLMNKTLTSPVEEIVLKPDTEVHIELLSSVSGLADFDATDVSVIEGNLGFFAEVGITGFTDQNYLTLFTQSEVTARISLHKKAQASKSGILFVSEPMPLEGHTRINITDSNAGTLRLEFRDTNNNPTSAHVQVHVMERSWHWSPYIEDYSFSICTFITSLSNFWIYCGVDAFENATRYLMMFNARHCKINAGEQVVIKFGGAINSRVLITPRAAADFKYATQVMLYTTDASKNVIKEVWKGSTLLRPHLIITTDTSVREETDMELCFVSKITQEFDRSENPRYNVTYDFGPFGDRSFEGSLYDENSLKMIVLETERLISQSPAIDYDLRVTQVNYYETLFQAMEELMKVPTDYKIGVISNIQHAGFEDEILHGFKLELPLEIMFPTTWPLGDGFIGHEMGHGRIHKPPANFWMYITSPYARLFEAYATLLGYKARTMLYGDERLYDCLMGSHDLFLRHQHGVPVIDDGDYIETMQFIVYFIDKNYGFSSHRSMILEWENGFLPVRNLLSDNGFSKIGQIATIYSYILGDNLGWLFKMGNFDVNEDTVNSGINLIIQDQQQTGNDELKVGETTAVTYTTSVPIMLRRVPSSLSRINVTLAFDHNMARVLQVHKRDLTDNNSWNLTTTQDIPGQLTIELEGLEAIKGLGSIAQVNFALIPTKKSELPITVVSASTNSGNTVIAEEGRINLSQLSIVRPKNLPFKIVREEDTYYVIMSSNSTISHFVFNQPNLTLSLDVTAPIGTTGFCNAAIPKELLWGDFIVYIDGSPLVKDIDYTETFNGTHYIFYISYSHTTRMIEIVGSNPRPWDMTGTVVWVPDDKCDMRDVELITEYYGAIEGITEYDSRADITGPTDLVRDGKIDMRDIALVAKHYGEIYS